MSAASPSPPDASAVIERFAMRPHPEGGYYVETYRSAGLIPHEALPEGFGGERAFSTAILYLLKAGERSCLHRIRQDETWHFHLGGPLRLVSISPDGELREVRIGADVLGGEHVQHTVPAGYWFGATPAPESAYSFVGCTVAPGFAFADFEMGRADNLMKSFPHLAETIRAFT